MNTLLFLDLDGVINCGRPHANGYLGSEPQCVAQLNRIIAATDCHLVISSSWRYLVLSSMMTLVGFENLLLTHGVNCLGRIRAITGPDMGADTRGLQIRRWLDRCKVLPDAYVVIDDDADIDGFGHSFVHTDGKVGLTAADADEAIAILKGDTP